MSVETGKLKVCVIGAGQAGMAALYYFAKLGDRSPEVTCYETSATWGGQWRCPWQTDTDEHGERVRSGMYRSMWINLPKEATELPHYTFHEHFRGNNTPSYFTAPVMRQYLEGYWKSSTVDLSAMIRYNTIVTGVKYNEDTDYFTVVTRDTAKGKTSPPEAYSHVIVASGVFTRPNMPEFKGFDKFPGRILHSQQFRGGEEFRGKRVLIVGASMSAEDIASQCCKYGARHVIITWKDKPLGFKFPDVVEERPLLQELEGKVAKFKDGSTAEVDAIVLCTGYYQSFPFLEDCLKLQDECPHVIPEGLYKGIVWMNAGNSKLLYIGSPRFPMPVPSVDVQAAWIVRYVTGINPVKPEDTTPAGLNMTVAGAKEIANKIRAKYSGKLSQLSMLTATKDVLRDLADDVGYFIKIEELVDMIEHSLAARKDDVIEFRNLRYTSPYTGVTSLPPHTKWIDNYDDVVGDFIKVEEIVDMIEHSLASRNENVIEFRNLQYTSAYTGVTSLPPHTKWIDNFNSNMHG